MYPACTEVQQTTDPDNMVSVFGASMNQPFRCWAKNGASNHWIAKHIDYFLADRSWPADTFLLVGWTSFEREEWPWLYSNISVCGGPDFGVPEPMRPKFNEWKSMLTEEYLQERIYFWHDQIHRIHMLLLDHGVPHLFWCTYDNFKSVTDHLDWHGNFYKPYDQDGCMCKHLDSKNIKALPQDPFHYDSVAHREWGNALSQHAKKYVL
jgi:hypothetical protein